MSQRICYIENGEITNPQTIRKQFEELQDGVYLVKISTRKNRSLNQNAYYWGVVCDLVMEGLKDAGYREVKTTEDAHEVMKSLFLKKAMVSETTGEVMEIHGTTTTLSTVEFNIYIDEVAQWAAEYLGITIPLPNES